MLKKFLEMKTCVRIKRKPGEKLRNCDYTFGTAG
jgi:hypothetical protein